MSGYIIYSSYNTYKLSDDTQNTASNMYKCFLFVLKSDRKCIQDVLFRFLWGVDKLVQYLNGMIYFLTVIGKNAENACMNVGFGVYGN